MLVADAGGVRMKDIFHMLAMGALLAVAWVGKWVVVAMIFKWVFA